MATTFQTFSSSVRPHRVAVLTKSDDPDWQSTCLAIIEFFTKLWGGGHSIIVPTNGRSIDDVFWALLSAHDPDLILTYATTGEDLRRNQPDEFEAAVKKNIAASAGLASDAGEQRKEISRELAKVFTGELDISEDLSKQILIRLAPFAFNGKVEWHRVTAGGRPYYPLTSIIDVVDQLERPKNTIQIKNDSSVPDLWLASALGWPTPDHLSALNAKGIPATPVIASQFSESDLIRWGIEPWRDFPGNTLFDISQLGLGVVRAVRAHTFDLPTLLVVGDSVEDFCLYYALLRLHGRAAWIPNWFRDTNDEFHGRLISALRKAEELGRVEHADSTKLVSASIQHAELEKIVASLASAYSHLSVAAERLSASFVRQLVKYPLRVYAKGSIEKQSTHQLLDDELPGTFESLKPIVFKTVNPQEHRWIVEVAFPKHRIPRHPALGSLMASSPNLGENSVRASSDGLVFVCPGAFVSGIDPDFNLVRPTIRVPNADQIFRRTLTYCGYDCEVSDKGRYEAEMIEKLGGIELAGRALQDSRMRALFEKYLDQSAPTERIYDAGVLLKDQRRYLNFAAITKLLGAAELATQVVDNYISRQIFFRGLVLFCTHCSNVDWFSIDDITHTFTCRRCGKKQQYTKRSWKHPEEPSWFYKLDEIVYQALLNNSVVPILTLAALGRNTRESFLFCPELRISLHGEKKHFMELDICCIPDGRLCIGEAKSNGTLTTKDFSATDSALRYRELASRLGATRVIFSTTNPAWDTASELAIESTFSGSPHILVSKLAVSDL